MCICVICLCGRAPALYAYKRVHICVVCLWVSSPLLYAYICVRVWMHLCHMSVCVHLCCILMHVEAPVLYVLVCVCTCVIHLCTWTHLYCMPICVGAPIGTMWRPELALIGYSFTSLHPFQRQGFSLNPDLVIWATLSSWQSSRILLSPPQHWYHRHVPPHPAFLWWLGTEVRSSCLRQALHPLSHLSKPSL